MAKSKYLNKSGLNYLWQKIYFGFKPKQAPVNITSTPLNFIDSISQDADGVISATKSELPQICGLTGSTGNIIYHDGSKWTVLGKPSSDTMILGSSSGKPYWFNGAGRYIPFGGVIQPTNIFGGKQLYINHTDDALHAADRYYYVKITTHKKEVNGVTYPRIKEGAVVTDKEYYEDSPVVSTLTAHSPFDGSYETSVVCPNGHYMKVHIQFSPFTDSWDPATATYFSGYPYGNYYLSFYSANTPKTTPYVRVYNQYQAHTKGWKIVNGTDYNGTKGNTGGNNYIARITDQGNYQRSCLEFIIEGKDDGSSNATRLTTIEQQLSRPNLAKDGSTVTKFDDQVLEYKFTWKSHFSGSTGQRDRIIIDPSDAKITAAGLRNIDTSHRSEYEFWNTNGTYTPISAIQGITGKQGITGLQGITGKQGIQGITGLQGITGKQGIQGPQGVQGITGTQGVQGPQGVQGITGKQGIQGNQGVWGITGKQGVQGITGLQGITGKQGITGAEGPTGKPGRVGRPGEHGEQGITGEQGVQGITGKQGITGEKGPTGNPGPDLLGSKGDIIYHNGTKWTTLAIGATGYVLKQNNGVPSWAVDNNSDTKVSQTVNTTDNTFPVLASAVANASNTQTTTAIYAPIKINPNKKSVAEGEGTTASGNYSHAEGQSTTSLGNAAHAEGHGSTASGYASHAEGNRTTAYGYASHAEGENTKAEGNYSHAEGSGSVSSGAVSHAEGYGSTASGSRSHAEGSQTTASGYAAHAGGNNTIANADNQTVIGQFNALDTNQLFIVGNGNSTTRKNIFTVSTTGTMMAADGVQIKKSSSTDQVSLVYDNAKKCLKFIFE